MKKLTIAAVIVAAPALALGIAACGGSNPAVPAARSSATVPAAQSPVGTWNVAYTSSPADIFGQYVITQSGGTYTLTVKVKLSPPYLNCTLPNGTEEGTFEAAGPTSFAGNGKLWTQDTCTYAYMSPIALRFSGGNELVMQYSDGGGPESFTLTRVGTTPPSTPAQTTTPAVAPSTAPAQTVPTQTQTPPTQGGLTRCGLNSNEPQAEVYSIFAGPGTSCPFANSVGDQYRSPGVENVYSPTTGQTYAMDCEVTGPDGNGGSMITCTGGNDAVVKFDVTSANASGSGGSGSTGIKSTSAPVVNGTGCFIPDEIGAGENGHISAAAALATISAVSHTVNGQQQSCGFKPVAVYEYGPTGTPAGSLWKEVPSAGDVVPPGTTVTFYYSS